MNNIPHLVIPLLTLTILACTPRPPVEPGEATEGLQHDIFISSRNTNAIKHYDFGTGHYLGDYIPPNENDLRLPQDVAFGPGGELLVSARGRGAILRYDSRTGAYLGEFTSGYVLDNPTKMSFGPDGHLYVSQWGERQSGVARFDGNTGRFIDEFTDNLNQPLDHTWDRNGDFYVACFGSREIRRYDDKGRFRQAFTEGYQLQGPTNLWFGDDRDLFVVDWPTGRVVRFDGRSGRYERTFIEGLQRAEGYAFSPDGRYLFICDWQANVVNRYDARTGAFVDVFTGAGGLQQPNAIVVRP